MFQKQCYAEGKAKENRRRIEFFASTETIYSPLAKNATNKSQDWPIEPVNRSARRGYQLGKRLIDLLVSSVVLLVGLPIYGLLSLITALSSPGPILYRQERIGRGGQPFFIYKFRSMYVNAETAGPRLSSGRQDKRITAWGWFMRRNRLDELPQFYNVLKGDMSLVGPRPERQFYIDQLVRQVPAYRNLLQIRPGITSLGQVQYGYASSLEEMIERVDYDLAYVRQQSPVLDSWILIRTVGVMFRGIGR